jgi:alanyl-tRNA synthetase
MSAAELVRVEAQVRKAIDADLPVHAEVVPLAEARGVTGLRAVFGETYPDPVRLVTIGATPHELLADPKNGRWRAVSAEFCGGTHLTSTKEAQAFAIIGEEGVAKGVRRVTALTGDEAAQATALADKLRARLSGAGGLDMKYLPAEVSALVQELEQAVIPLTTKGELRAMLAPLTEKVKGVAKQAAGAERDKAVAAARTLAEQASGSAIVLDIPAGGDRDALLAALDAVRARHANSAVLLVSASGSEAKVTIVAAVPPALVEKGLKAGDWVREASAAVGGKGGGRPDAAQGGGTEPAKLGAAIEAARKFAAGKVA